MFRQASPNYNPDFMLNVIGQADDFIRARVPTATAQTMLGEGGGAFNVVAGMPGVATATPVTVGRAPAAQGTAVTPATTAEAPVEAIPSRGGQTAPQDLIEQGVNPASIPMGNPLQRPTSFAPGSTDQTAAQPMSMDAAPQIIQAAVQNGNIGENDLQSLRQMVGAQYEPQLAQWMEQNNIRITPAGEPSMRSAVYRPGVDAAPQMQQVQTNAPGTQFRGRDPNVSPLPGSSQVPIERVQAEAQAGREPVSQAAARAGATTRAEREAEAQTAYQRERNTRQAEADTRFMEQYQGAAETVRNNLNVVDQMIGDARVANGSVVVPRGRRAPHPGFGGVIGMGIPGMRLIPGTSEADFDGLFNQVTGAAFLQAFETLKGGGAITEREGQAATSAITRLSRNLSEVEFVRAATELRDIMRRGLERAESRAARITGTPTRAATPQPRPRTSRGTSVTGTW
jgi:hypothetical protein